jgi:hypothetical protein
MAYYSSLRGYKFPGAAVMDIRGAAVYGPKEEKGERKPGEEKLGKIQEVIFDGGTGEISYVVLDTGELGLSKWFIIPGDALRASPKHKDGYQVDLTLSQVETFPRYEVEEINSPEVWEKFEERRRAYFPQSPAGEHDERWTAFQERVRQHCESMHSAERDRKAG